MKKSIIIILVLSVLLMLLTAGILGYYQITMINQIPISAKITSNGASETVTCWQNENGEYYLFLPAYAELSEVSIRKETSVELFLDGMPILDGMSGEELETDRPYVLTYTLYGKERRGTLTIMRSGGVPTMYIDTLSGNMDYIHEKKRNEESASIRLYDANGILCNDADIEAINGRGNSTWQWYDKKPYSLHFASEIDLLGMGAAKEWILLANAADKSNIRNKLVYDFAAALGLDYSPESDWVDLYLNGNYAGLYLLCERNEVHENRVNISGERICLVSMEMESRLKEANLAHVLTEAKQALRIHYPLQIDTDTFASLSYAWQSVENAILSENGIDELTGKSWQELIDPESWAKKYLIEEVFGNIDAGYLSQYFYMDESGKAFAGPVWDYDHALGSYEHWQLESPNILTINEFRESDRPWFYALCQKEEFLKCVISVYQAEFVPLMETVFMEDIEKYLISLSEAAAMNSVRWFAGENWTDSVYDIALYMDEKIDFFDSFWLSDTEFHFVYFGEDGHTSYQLIAQGETVAKVPVLDDTVSAKFIGWYYEGTDEPFDPEAPICEDIVLYAKWENIPVSKIKTLVKIMPVGVIAVIFLGLLFIDIKRNIRMRRG